MVIHGRGLVSELNEFAQRVPTDGRPEMLVH
jgi:hypothetical protein